MTPESTRSPAVPPDDGPPLRAQTVTLTDGSVRWTVSPVDADVDRETTAWLTVDDAVVVSLAEMR